MRAPCCAAAVGLVASTIVGCCFTTSETIDIDTVTVTPPPATPPGYDVLSICAPDALVEVAGSTTPRCAAHASTLPTSVTSVEATFHTRSLARFAGGGALVAGTGEGPGFVEIAREELRGPGPVDPTATTLTWNVQSDLTAPQLVGWPPSVPIHFRVLDTTGAIAFESTSTFTGPPVAPPPERGVGELRVCLASGLFGPEDDRYCGSTTAAVPAGPGQLWFTYSTAERAALQEGFVFVLERRDRGSWEEVFRDPTEGTPEPNPDMTYTLARDFDLSSRGWRPGSEWRARLTTTGGRALGEREFRVD